MLGFPFPRNLVYWKYTRVLLPMDSPRVPTRRLKGDSHGQATGRSLKMVGLSSPYTLNPKRILRLASSCFSLSIFAVPRAPDLFAGSLQMNVPKACFFKFYCPT